MINAKKEFLDEVKGLRVRCAEVFIGFQPWPEEEDLRPVYRLKENYTSSDYEAFLDSLDFEYDDGFGSQELFGTIWYVGGTWSDRREYDGSEWWKHQKRPKIPKELKK